MKTLFSLLFLVEVSWLMIDAASGFLIFAGVTPAGSLTLGAAYRALVTVLLLAIALNQSREDQYLALGLVLFCAVFAYWHVAGGRSDLTLVQNTFRLMLAPLFYIAVRAQLQAGQLGRRGIVLICAVNSAVLLGNVYLTYFNLGFEQYGVTQEGTFRGGSGFFYAGNEVAGSFLALLGLLLALLLRSGALRYVLVIVLFLVGAISMLSRTALAGFALLTCAALFVSRPRIAWAAVSMVLIGLISLFNLYWTYIEYAIDRWRYFSAHYGMSTFLLGGAKRLTHIQAYFDALSADPLILFYGVGWVGKTENNIFDLLEAFGVWGLIFYLIWSTWIANSWTLAGKGMYPRELFIAGAAMLLLLLVSAFAGHILQSAMLAPFVAMLATLHLALQSDPGDRTARPSVATRPGRAASGVESAQ